MTDCDSIRPATSPLARRRPKLLFLVTEDWYFCSHRLPVARAARDDGFEVVVATRVQAHGEQIREEGFTLYPIAWRRRGDGLVGAGRAVVEIIRLYRSERPDILHHVALKPVLFGGLARALAFRHAAEVPASIDSVMGLGSGFSSTTLAARLRRPSLGVALRLAAASGLGRVVVQNPEDGDALAALGIDPERIVLIRGSGVDVRHFAPLPMPDGNTVTVALVSRMLRDKGVLDAVAAIRRLRERGLAIELVLAGPTDADNAGSMSPKSLSALAVEPGITWLGAVADVRAVWRRAAIAVLPSTYGEGVPKALLEAAACAPGPGAQRAPVVGFTRTAVIHQADDALPESGSIVCLHACRIEEHKAPAVGDELPGIRRASVCIQLRKLKGSGFRWLPCGMICEDIFQRRVLLDKQRLPGCVNAVEFVARGLVWRGEACAAEHH